MGMGYQGSALGAGGCGETAIRQGMLPPCTYRLAE